MSRRDQIRMSEEEVKSFLEGKQTLIINSIGHDGVPHPMPMWFALDEDGAVLMTTFKKSQKVKNLERDPRVSVLGEDGTEYAKLRGVVLYGEAQLIPGTDDVIDILMQVASRNAADMDPTNEAVRAGMRKTAEKRVGIRILPQKVVSWDHTKLGGVY